MIENYIFNQINEKKVLLIMEYSLDKYKYFVPTKADGTPYKVVAVSTYAGRTVRGVAKCDPKDTFDTEKGKQLAAARCQAKVSSQRLKRATKKLDEAVKALEKAQKYYDDMTVYFNDSARDKEMYDSVVERLTKEM